MIRGQRAAKVRRHGVWVEVDADGNVAEAEDTSYEPENLDPEPETLSDEVQAPGQEEEAVAEPEPEVDFTKMSRAELDAFALAKGLDPSEFKNRNLLIEGINAQQ